MTRAKLEDHLSQLRERLLPYYEEDEQQLTEDIERQRHADVGAVGLMAAIAWCYGQLGIYEMLNSAEQDKEA